MAQGSQHAHVLIVHSGVKRKRLAREDDWFVELDDDDQEPPHHQSRAEYPTQPGKEVSDRMIFQREMSTIETLRAPTHWRERIHVAFIDSYYSERIVHDCVPYINIYYWHAPQSMAMTAARDALYLVQLGIRFRDQRILTEGRLRHCAALRCIRESIEKPDALHDDAMLGACYTVAHCEIYRVISQDGSGWQAHVDGINSVLRQRGPKSIKSPFAQALLHNCRQVEVMDALLRRKGSFFASDDWIEAVEDMPAPAIVLTNIALCVTTAIEKADSLCRERGQQEVDIVDMLTELVALESQLNDWLVGWYVTTRCQSVPYRLVSITKFDAFANRLGGLAHIVPKAMEFPSFVCATTHAYVWVVLLVLRHAIADVARLHPYPLLRPLNQNAILTAAVNECASNLCRTVPFLASAGTSAGTLACGGPLHFASRWYKQRRDLQRSVWCDHVRDFLQHDTLTGISYDASINLQKPVLTWWMLPDIFATQP